MTRTLILRAIFCLSTGRGMGATRRIERGEVVLHVPFAMCITPRKLLREADSRECDLTPRELFALNLAKDALDPASRWQRYYRALPRSYDLVECWRPHAIEHLHTRPLRAFFHRRRDGVRRSFETVNRYLQSRGQATLTWKLFAWAMGTISTRCVYVSALAPRSECASRDDAAEVGVLVPLFCFFNHTSDPATAAAFDVHEDGLAVRVRPSVCLASSHCMRSTSIFASLVGNGVDRLARQRDGTRPATKFAFPMAF